MGRFAKMHFFPAGHTSMGRALNSARNSLVETGQVGQTILLAVKKGLCSIICSLFLSSLRVISMCVLK